MTKWFEMDKFISAVVAEEEQKHRIEESYGDGAEESQMDKDEEEETNNVNLVGTSRTQQVRNIERLKRRQRKASRRKYLESVTPRLEILQNMPFFIPFATRVQIFREFVRLDQIRRRGSADADEWRFRMMNSGPSGGDMSRHRAKVRRENIFDDAYEQFFQLGEGLKEPIQIKFVDKFDTVEEGIDGGGVTKEFLTSVTSEAFSPNNGLNLFVENDQHLLYPNPSAIEEREDLLQQAGVKRGSAEWNQSIRDLLQRYEFLGRIVGKCLYEGILVDIHFAGFFLLKWALTGGNGSATKESGYRANLNDIRDLDESLFQGLVSTKPHYPTSTP
jgi:ubiquitin-protein ligase E3 C